MTSVYRLAPWVLLRTPTLPAESAELARDPRRALDDPEVVRALAIASPTLLADALRERSAPPTGEPPRDAARTEQGLARYLIRMSTRPTPYGAFAAVSLARWATRTDLSLGVHRHTRTRPDMGWLRGLLAACEARPEVRRRLRWRSDPLAHESGDRLVSSGGGSVRATGPARIALAESATPIGHEDLVARVASASGGSLAQVEGLLDQLRAAGLLRSDLVPALTGPGATSGSDAADVLRSVEAALAEQVCTVLTAIAAADAAPPDAARDAFGQASAQASALFASEETLQTDLSRDLEGEGLSAEVGRECARAAEVLVRLGPGPAQGGDLAQYARRFHARWGRDREVPLAEVFDPVQGLGPLPHTHGAASGPDAAALARSELLMTLALEALRDGRRAVDLDAASLDQLGARPLRGPGYAGRGNREAAVEPPLSLDVAALVVAADAAAVDRGEFTVVIGPNLGAGVGGRWLGRFADLFGDAGLECYAWLARAEAEARAAARAAARAPADPEVAAEVVYLPDNARSTNVVLRPTVSGVEIVVSGRGSAEHQLGLDDLLVGHDGTGLYLRSRRLGVRVRPTARHMLNHHGAPAVVQFLDAVGHAHAAEFTGFDWGEAERLPVLPRVTAGRAVLAPARWLVSLPGRLPAGYPDRAVLARLEDALASARRRWGLPDRVYASTADNRLLLDLSRPQDVEQLRREARTSGGVLRLTEALPDVGDAWVPGPDGAYLNEIVVTLVGRPAAASTSAEDGPAGAAVTDPAPLAVGARRLRSPGVEVHERVRVPGSDWLYAKFYAPYEQHTHLLADLGDLVEMAENSGLARRWFFVRYSDPEPHLRLRWQGDPDLLLRHLLPQVGEFGRRLVETGRITGLGLDTYDREVQRYGGPTGLALCEEVFHLDSRAIRAHLSSNGSHEAHLTEAAVASVAALLDGLGLEQSERIAFYEAQVALVDDSRVARTAGEDYRTRKASLRSAVADPDGWMTLRSGLAPLGEALRTAERAGDLAGPLGDLWPSLVHMHHNRLVGPTAAPSEAHVLHLLLRTERGLLLSGRV